MDNSTIIPALNKEDNLVGLYMSGVPKKSRKSYMYSLNQIARKFGAPDAWHFAWASLGNAEVTIIRAWLLEGHSPATTLRTLVPLKGVLSKAFDLGLIDGDTYLRAVKPCKIRLGNRPKASTGRMLSEDEIQALLLACHRGPPTRGTRDLAIISLMVYSGMRRAEVCSATLADYNPTFFGPDVGRLNILGKGEKWRTMPIKASNEPLAAWLKLRGNKPGPLFCRIMKSDKIRFQGMSVMSLWRMVNVRREMAGVEPFLVHDIRRTWASRALGRGVDVLTVASLMGHSNPETTMRYDRRPEDRKVDGIE